MSDKKVRVLVIDDSAYNRQTIAEILQGNDEIEVVGKASDGEEGLKQAAQLKPDLITLDLEMPKMDGFTFLRILMSKLPTPVIVISSHSKKQSVFQALELGALDFIAKPTRHISPDLLVIREELIGKVLLFRHLRMDNLGAAKAAAMPQLMERKSEEGQTKERVAQPMASELRLVCIGASTGGPPAIQMLLAQLQENIPTCILVCQHMPAKFTKAFAERLDKTAKIRIKEAEDMDPLLAGSAYITPGGGNMIISRVDGRRVLRVVPGEPEDRYVPSIDKLFLSVADTFGNKALGIVLTGMGTDGKVGALKMRERGAMVIAESKESAVIYGMPKEVVESGAADLVLPLPKIGDALIEYCAGKKLEGAQGGR